MMVRTGSSIQRERNGWQSDTRSGLLSNKDLEMTEMTGRHPLSLEPDGYDITKSIWGICQRGLGGGGGSREL